MLDIFIFVIAVAVFVLILTSTEEKKSNKMTVLTSIKSINKAYLQLFTEESFIIRITQCTMITLSEIFTLISLSVVIFKFLNLYTSIIVSIYLKVAIVIGAFVLVHYLMGYILIITANFHSLMSLGIEKSIKGYFLLSYFITTAYIAVLILFPEELGRYIFSGLIGIIICYYINFKLLIKIMRNPRYVKIDYSDRTSFSRVFIVAITIVFMIIINLYLAVCLIKAYDPLSFSASPSYFDLLYYTIVTFTTIGFGDICPLSVSAKFISILISISSIVCLTIFLGSVFSFRGKN